MINNNKKIIGMMSLILLIIIAFPFVLSKDNLDKIIISFGLINGLTSLITLFVAIKLYDRFDSEKNLHQKRSEKVFKLVELLNKNFIVISFRDKTNFMSINPFNFNLNSVEPHYQKNVRISTHYMYTFRLINSIATELYLPASIAEKIKKLDIIGLTDLNHILKSNEVLVSAYPTSFPEEKTGKPIGVEINLMDFLNLWNDLSEEIKNWLENNYNSYEQLNIK